MSRHTFDPNPRVIRLPVIVKGPTDRRAARAIFDPGAASVVLHRGFAVSLGVRPEEGSATTVATAAKSVAARRITIEEVQAVGQTVHQVSAVVIDLPPSLKADVLLGNTFLQHFTVSFDLADGYLELRPRNEAAP